MAAILHRAENTAPQEAVYQALTTVRRRGS